VTLRPGPGVGLTPANHQRRPRHEHFRVEIDLHRERTAGIAARLSRKINRPVLLRVSRHEEFYIGSARGKVNRCWL